MRAVNQQNIARKLRLSRTTVSRSLSNHPAISAETRERVQSLAVSMGYRGSPTRAVRKARRSKPITFGVLIGQPLVAADLATFPHILQGMRHRAAIDHAALDVVSVEPADLLRDSARKQIFRHIRQADWRGAVLIYPFPAPFLATISRKISAVSALTEYEGKPVDVIDTDHGDVRLLVARLVALGHRRIGFASWHYAVGGVWASRRFAAFAEGLWRAGLTPRPEWVFNVGHAFPRHETPGAIADAAARAMRDDGVTAWVCAADHQAYQLVSDLNARGLRVPEDCSVTGFDGNEPPPGLPPLATLRVPNEDIGASAIARLVSRLLHRRSPQRRILVGTTFHPGATLAPPPAAR